MYHFFFFCTNFSDYYNLLNVKKKLDKFGIVGKPRLEYYDGKYFGKKKN